MPKYPTVKSEEQRRQDVISGKKPVEGKKKGK
jgi:hypothetical protein